MARRCSRLLCRRYMAVGLWWRYAFHRGHNILSCKGTFSPKLTPNALCWSTRRVASLDVAMASCVDVAIRIVSCAEHQRLELHVILGGRKAASSKVHWFGTTEADEDCKCKRSAPLLREHPM